MKRKKYTEHFEQFWRGLDRSFPLGNKMQAYDEFIKLECNQEDVNFLINSYNAQVAAKNRTMKQGIWEANPKHINRWQDNVGEDMGGSGSGKTSDRTDNVLNFPLLDVPNDGH